MKSAGRQKEIKRRLRALVPKASLEDFLAIEEIANSGHLRHLPPSIAAWQGVTTRARHAHTEYDALLAEGYEVEAARHFVLEDTNDQLILWGCTEKINSSEDV